MTERDLSPASRLQQDNTSAWPTRQCGGTGSDFRMHLDTTKQRAAPIAFEDFLKVEIRVGTIVACDPYPEARKPSYKLQIDFGPDIGLKRSAAQITAFYQPADLIGRQVACVTNFPPRQIGKFMSEVLTLGFPSETGEVVLISPERNIPNGGRLF